MTSRHHMLRDHPFGAELLAEARRILDRIKAPGDSLSRYQVLMISRAMQLAARELEVPSGLEQRLTGELARLTGGQRSAEELTARLASGIRTGAFDGSDELYGFLRLVTAFKLRESNPPAVPPELEQALGRMAGGSAEDGGA